MMSVTIDPSEARAAPRHAAARRPMAPVLRTLVLGGLGGVGLVGFSVGAYSMLGELARPQIAKVAIGRQAAEWPDLKDGLPAMAPPSREAPKPLSQGADARPASDPRGAMPMAAPIATPSPRVTTSPAPPPMEVGTVIESVRFAPLVTPARLAALVPPTSAQTVRARGAEVRAAAIPPEPVVVAAPRPVRKQSVANVRPKPASEPASGAAAAPAAASSPAEAEETEVFGMKVPTLASSGRKLVEGVQSLGDAVASQF